MLMRLAVLGTIAAALLPTAPAPAPASAPMGPARTLTVTDLTVSVTVDTDGAPRGLTPIVVALNNATRRTSATLELATPGVPGSCVGRPRFDAVRRTLSRTCYARIPAGRAGLAIHGSARLAVAGTTVTLDGVSALVSPRSS